jgi:hypothetical protein
MKVALVPLSNRPEDLVKEDHLREQGFTVVHQAEVDLRFPDDWGVAFATNGDLAVLLRGRTGLNFSSAGGKPRDVKPAPKPWERRLDGRRK